MSQNNQHLSGYSLKLSTEDRRAIKLAAAAELNYLYEWCDKAVQWAEENKDTMRPLANTRTGRYSTFYLSQANTSLVQLEDFWGCSASRALLTAVIGYLNRNNPPLEQVAQA